MEATKSYTSKLEKSFATAKFIIKKKRKLIDEMCQRTDLNENQKIFIGSELELINIVEDLIKKVKLDTHMHLGKLPPQEVELEQKILGAVILESVDGLDKDKNIVKKRALSLVETLLLPEHFYWESNNMIYACILKLAKANKPFDISSLVTQLRSDGILEAVGGATYIANLIGNVTSSANIDYDARILIERAVNRSLIMMAGMIIRQGYEDTTDCFEMLESAEAQFKEINSWIRQ